MNPDAKEICGNGVDDDCDGLTGSCALEGEIDVDTAWARVQGRYENDVMGYGMEAADYNGDGVIDLAVGADAVSSGDGYVGAVHVVLGPLSGTYDLSKSSSSDIIWEGEDYWDFTGSRGKTAAGDANGDGYADLAAASGNHGDGGRVYLVLGPVSADGLFADADALIDGDSGDNFGRNCEIGDVTADGIADLVIAASGSSELYVYDGTVTGALGPTDATAVIAGQDGDQVFGDWLDLRGDLNGDGVADLSTTAGWAGDGWAVVWSGPLLDGQTIDDADMVVKSTNSSWGFGYNAISSGGDLNNDGYDDLVVGAYYYPGDGSGGAFVYFGPPSGELAVTDHDIFIEAEASGDYFGYSTTIVGDTNGDGNAELSVGSFYNDAGGEYAGATYMFYGPLTTGTRSAATADARFVGTLWGWAGMTAPGEDFNGDGLEDILVGSAGATVNKSRVGEVYLFLGGGI